MAVLYPLLCQPIYKERIWGGRRLERMYGKDLPPEVRIGESWEVADLPEGASLIANGPFEGRTLTEVTHLLGADLLGTAWPEGRFPLLVKLLDANDDLSVQVHPSAEDCRQWFPEAASKDESWLVVASEPGSRVFYGFKPGVTPADFERALAHDTLLGLLAAVEVQPGDVLRVAPGTVHALGCGVAVLEVQEPSDTTFRLHDFGRGREVHLEQGRRVVRVASFEQPLVRPVPHETDWGVREVLVDVPAYRFERIAADEPVKWQVNPASAVVLTVLEGTAELGWAGGALRLEPGQTLILPAALGEVQLTPLAAVLLVAAGAGGVSLLQDVVGE